MSSGPEEEDSEILGLVAKLGPPPERDPRAAAQGRSSFLAEARSYRASVSAGPQQRRMGWKENAMRLTRIPVFLLVIALIGVAMVSLLTLGPLIGNTFSTINDSLNSVGGPLSGPLSTAPDLQLQPSDSLEPTGAAALSEPGTRKTGQMVVKNGEIRLLVKDTDRALDGLSQIVTDTQGYVLSSRVWYQDYYGTNWKYATLTIGVQADLFETAMRRLRSLAVRVLEDTASGQDVTGQYIDLQSQLTNLEATRNRIKAFLDQAKSVDEALRINQQLTDVEGQIEQIKGQMNYLSNRAAFSTITINLEPELPKIVATPTPTATPTPIEPLGSWDGGATTQRAAHALVSVYRLIADSLIWLFVVLVPVAGPPVVLTWLARGLIRRRTRAGAKGQGA